jgi:hypothetical protein
MEAWPKSQASIFVRTCYTWLATLTKMSKIKPHRSGSIFKIKPHTVFAYLQKRTFYTRYSDIDGSIDYDVVKLPVGSLLFYLSGETLYKQQATTYTFFSIEVGKIVQRTITTGEFYNTFELIFEA